MAPIHLIVELTSLRPKCCVGRLVSSDERLVTPILVLRVGIIHELVALAKIILSCRGEEDLPPPWIVLVVFSFCDVAASSNKRLVIPALVLRVGLSHEPVALAKIKLSRRGEKGLLPPWIVLVVFSFYDVTASSNKRCSTV